MKPGTPGFSGARLALARRARGLTAAALADMVDVSRQAISQYERDIQSPRPEVMESLRQVLGFPHAFFVARGLPPASAPTFFRSYSTASARSRDRAVAMYALVREVVAWVSEQLELPPVDIPDITPNQPFGLSDEAIEDAAQDVRRHFGLGTGPISNVVWLLENKGIIVGRFPFEDAYLDGFSQWPEMEDRPFVLLSADKESAARSRFDAAHELGHLVLHRGVRQKPGAEFSRLESQAHRFAAAFLLPQEAFLREAVPLTLATFQVLKRRWAVSIGMMIVRATHLDLLSDESTRRLWRQYASRGWKRREPLDDDLPVEMPRLLPRAFELLLTDGGRTAEQILADVPLTAAELERIAGLSPGRLRTPPGDLLALRPRQASPIKQNSDRGGEVVPFRPSRGK